VERRNNGTTSYYIIMIREEEELDCWYQTGFVKKSLGMSLN
jgi:hypothetical protein